MSKAAGRLCPAWLRGERDDIIQVAMMRLHQVIERSEGEGVPSSSYIWRTAFTVIVDEIRRRTRRPEVPIGGDASADELADGGVDPERQAIAHEAAGVIRACLRALVTARRAAVVLHLQGHGVPEIAVLLGWSAKRAENAVYRGLKDLRGCLRAKGVQP